MFDWQNHCVPIQFQKGIQKPWLYVKFRWSPRLVWSRNSVIISPNQQTFSTFPQLLLSVKLKSNSALVFGEISLCDLLERCLHPGNLEVALDWLGLSVLWGCLSLKREIRLALPVFVFKQSKSNSWLWRHHTRVHHEKCYWELFPFTLSSSFCH